MLIMPDYVFEPFTTQSGRESLEQCLPAWLQRQRWFGAKTRGIETVEIVDWQLYSTTMALVFIKVLYDTGGADTYQLPLSLSGTNQIHDATNDERFRQVILHLIETNACADLDRGGLVSALQSGAFPAIRGTDLMPGKLSSAEQSNTSIVYGGKMILKLFRRLEPGENPDIEISRFLTEVAHLPHIMQPFLARSNWTATAKKHVDRDAAEVCRR